jgi:hypothetical protein
MSELFSPLTLEEEGDLAAALQEETITAIRGDTVVDATPTEPLTAEENAEIEELLASEAGFNGTIDTGFGRLCVLIEKRDYDETTLRLVPANEPGIRTLVSGSGTITRFRIVGGRKQIIDELIPMRKHEVIAGDTRMEDLSKRVLAGDPEALKLANRLGLEADVKWYKRVQPDRRKQNDSEAAAANPPPRGEAAEAATGELASAAIENVRLAPGLAASLLKATRPADENTAESGPDLPSGTVE